MGSSSKNRKRLNFVLPLVIYPFDIMISFGETDQEIMSALKKNGIIESDYSFYDENVCPYSNHGYVYVDKSQVYTATDFKTSFSTSGTYGIGVADVFGSIRGTWNGYIPICRVYVGKALTISEITQNFNTLRGRFGI